MQEYINMKGEGGKYINENAVKRHNKNACYLSS